MESGSQCPWKELFNKRVPYGISYSPRSRTTWEGETIALKGLNCPKGWGMLLLEDQNRRYVRCESILVEDGINVHYYNADYKPFIMMGLGLMTKAVYLFSRCLLPTINEGNQEELIEYPGNACYLNGSYGYAPLPSLNMTLTPTPIPIQDKSPLMTILGILGLVVVLGS